MSFLHQIWNLPEPVLGESLALLENESHKSILAGHNNPNGGFAFLNIVTRKLRLSATCRESFNSYIENQLVEGKKHDLYVFTTSKMKWENVVAFFAHIEELLGAEAHVKLAKTQFNNQVVFQPSAWWLETPLRHNALTLFMRCACCYYDGDFDKALRDYPLTQKTKPAIDFFLKGNTVALTQDIFHGPVMASGWVRLFEGLNTALLATKMGKKV